MKNFGFFEFRQISLQFSYYNSFSPLIHSERGCFSLIQSIFT